MNAPSPEIEEAPARGKVLVVDDATTVRRYHRMIIEDMGFAVEEAFNGVEALEIALRMPFDLFVVDVNMPEMDGYRFIAEMRKSPDLMDLPVIMVSTEAETGDQTKAYAAGANHYFVKPAKPDSIKLCIDLLLEGSK